MKLLLISPESTTEHTIAWIELPAQEGSLIVQRGHEPLVLMLKHNQSVVFKLKTGKQKTIVIQNGVAEIDREQVTLIVQLAQQSAEG
jgi:F0F1-type ATP synthase epsilon subunit